MASNPHDDHEPLDRVESLLRDFFADELCPAAPPPTPRTRHWWVRLAAVAACVLLIVWFATIDWTRREDDSVSPSPRVEEYLVIKDDEFLGEEVYSTPDGTVAQSASLQNTTVSMVDPASGYRLDVSVPQLVILVEPVDGQRKRRQR